MPEISPNNTGLSGEYFVAAELYRRGWSVGMTIGNAKAVDLFAEKDDTVVQIQVRAIYWRKNSGWPMMKNKIKMNCIYIFVNLNANPIISKMSAPDYFICTSVEAKKNMKQYRTRGIMNVGILNNERFKNRWDKLQLKSYTI
ncbi:MAG: hypothetical protein JST75_03755 [Bacteroidetes bacterium]|nr:hypothetical protein [Bacteroidota bacterium]